jgi:hypothetical protein
VHARGKASGPGLWVVVVVAMAVTGTACREDTASAARERLRTTHLPDLTVAVSEDVARHLAGVRDAAERLAPGFAVEDGAQRERQMRAALRYVQQPPRGIGAFIVSPMSFLAALDEDGVVIARDAEPDRMKGLDMARAYPVVREGLASGKVDHGLGEFPAQDDEPSSWSILFVAPVDRDGERVGAVVAGIPLWRLAQRLSRQLRVDFAKEVERGLVLWAYVLKGDRIFHKGVPPELTAQLPPAKDLQRMLADHPEGTTGHLRLHGRTYAYAVAPLTLVAADVGLLVVRGDP